MKNRLFKYCFLIGISLISFSSCNSNKFKNVRIACLGDSITYGSIPGDTGSQMENPYPSIIQKKLGCYEVLNYGVIASSVGKYEAYDYAPFVQRYISIPKDTNIITVMGGTNDLLKDRPLGKEGDTQVNNFYGALDYLCSHLKSRYPGSKILFFNILPTNYTEVIEEENVNRAIAYTCNKYQIPVLDLYHEAHFEENMSSDGIHPSQEFITNNMAPLIVNFIKNNY